MRKYYEYHARRYAYVDFDNAKQLVKLVPSEESGDSEDSSAANIVAVNVVIANAACMIPPPVSTSQEPPNAPPVNVSTDVT